MLLTKNKAEVIIGQLKSSEIDFNMLSMPSKFTFRKTTKKRDLQ